MYMTCINPYLKRYPLFSAIFALWGRTQEPKRAVGTSSFFLDKKKRKKKRKEKEVRSMGVGGARERGHHIDTLAWNFCVRPEMQYDLVFRFCTMKNCSNARYLDMVNRNHLHL